MELQKKKKRERIIMNHPTNLAFLDPLIPKQNSSIKRTGDEGFTSRTQAKRNNSLCTKKEKKKKRRLTSKPYLAGY